MTLSAAGDETLIDKAVTSLKNQFNNKVFCFTASLPEEKIVKIPNFLHNDSRAGMRPD